MSKPNRYYTFLLVEHVQFERDIDSPVLVKVTRHKEHSTLKKTIFKAQTTFLMADASHSIHYDSEFCIKIKIVKKHGKIGKQIINIKLEQMNALKKKREKIGEWIFDAANFDNPTSVDIRSSKTQLKQNMGEATLFFRCVVLPYSDYPDGPPEHFYNFVARTYSPQIIDINDTLTTTTETSLGDENVPQTNSAYIIEKRSNSEIFGHQPSEHLASFLKPVEMKTRKKQTDSESSTASEPVQPAPKAQEESDQSPESKSTSSKKKKDDSKAEDDGTKKKKKKSRRPSELKDDDGDPEKKQKKSRRPSELKDEDGDPEKKSKKKKRKNSKIVDIKAADPESAAEAKEDIEKDVKEKNVNEPDSPEKSEKEEPNPKSENEEQTTELAKDDQKSKSENEEQATELAKEKQPKSEKEGGATNIEKVPKFTQQPTPIKSAKQRKNSTNLSSLNSFFGEKKIRKKSSNVSFSDNPLSTDDSNNSLKPIHSYNNLHLNKYYDDFKPLYNKHQKAIMDLAINQCTPIFIKVVMDCLVAPPNVLQDFSDRLLEPINSYNILQFPALTSSDLLDLISPVYKGIKIAINRPHQLDEWFSILATTLNFGLKLSSTASLYTSAHIECLTNLAKYITQVIQQLTQTLVGTIGPSISDDGFTFADEQSMSMIEQVTRLFLEYTQAFNIPEQIVQVIVSEACNYIDALLFNAIIDTATVFTDEKVTSLLQKIRQIQQMFDCIPKNFQTAFNHLLGFISTTKALLIGVDDPDQRKVILLQKGPLLRSIIERCQPPIEMPEGISLDDFGEKIENTQSLKLPLETSSFNFTFEWLYTQNTSNNWDML